MRRVATDTELAGTQLERGAFLILGLASANRTDAEFARPDIYDIDRDPAELRQHVAFDRGIHSCVGAALVRIEAAAALNTILDRVTAIELADTTYRRVRHFIMRGPETSPSRSRPSRDINALRNGTAPWRTDHSVANSAPTEGRATALPRSVSHPRFGQRAPSGSSAVAAARTTVTRARRTQVRGRPAGDQRLPPRGLGEALCRNQRVDRRDDDVSPASPSNIQSPVTNPGVSLKPRC